jgi:hypothetical protein
MNKLKAVIERAAENGWEDPDVSTVAAGHFKWFGKEVYPCLLFSHDFAKACGYTCKDLGAAVDNNIDPLDWVFDFVNLIREFTQR